MSTTAEICERAIDGWKEATRTFMDEIIPAQTFLAFSIGSMSKEEKKKFKKTNPELYEIVIANIKKGQNLILGNNCKNCENKLDKEDNFCPKCGTSIKTELNS